MALERFVEEIPAGNRSLQKLIAELATETRRGFDRVAHQFEETDTRAHEIDERIDKLVVAIREFIRQQSSQPGRAN